MGETQQLIISRNATSASTDKCYVAYSIQIGHKRTGDRNAIPRQFVSNKWGNHESIVTIPTLHSILPCKRSLDNISY